VLKYLLALMMVILGFGCCAPRTVPHTQTSLPNHCHVGTFYVALDPTFDANHMVLAFAAIPTLEELGVHPIIVAWNNPLVQVRVVNWTNTSFPRGRCSDHRLGVFSWGSSHVFVDSRCAFSDNQFQVTVVHELGHWLGLSHVCNVDGITTDTCSRVGRGPAILNPYIESGHQLHFTNLDRAEYSRACPGRQEISSNSSRVVRPSS